MMRVFNLFGFNWPIALPNDKAPSFVTEHLLIIYKINYHNK